MLQHFESSPAKRKTTTKSHSPDYSSVSWDKEAVLRDLQNHPPAPPPINWQKLAQDHNIPRSNCRQVIEEFARKSNIDTELLDGRKSSTRSRMRKRRLNGGEISAAVPPSMAKVKESWREMVQNEEISLGVPVPYIHSHVTMSVKVV